MLPWAAGLAAALLLAALLLPAKRPADGARPGRRRFGALGPGLGRRRLAPRRRAARRAARTSATGTRWPRIPRAPPPGRTPREADRPGRPSLRGALPLCARADVPDGKWWKRPRVARAIGLTSDQTKQIEAIFASVRPQLIDLKADLEKKQFHLQQAIDADADRQQLEARIDEVEDARKDLQKTRALMLIDMKKVLSPEQWERLKQMRDQLRERRRQKG